MKVIVEFEVLKDIKIDEKDLPNLSEAIENCWFVFQVNRIEIN